MWTHFNTQGYTETTTIPSDGVVGVVKPNNVELSAFINNTKSPLHHLHVKEGDTLYFKLDSYKDSLPASVEIRYDDSIHKLDVMPTMALAPKSISKEMEEDMTAAREDVNIFGAIPNMGMGGGYGAGTGAAVGGFLGAALGRNGNLFGGGNGTDVSGLNNLQGAIDTNAILSNLADIKAAVPLAESQVQLALAGAQSDITQQNQAQTLALMQQANAGQLASVQLFANTGDKIDNVATQQAVGFGVLGSAIQKQTFDISQVVNNDGEKTRALISRQYEDTLNRQLTDAKNEVIELRGDRRIAEATGNITITNTNTANAMQAQNQAQQQFQILANLAAQVQNLAGDIQSVRQATSNVNFGVQGANTQTNSASNNRVN